MKATVWSVGSFLNESMNFSKKSVQNGFCRSTCEQGVLDEYRGSVLMERKEKVFYGDAYDVRSVHYRTRRITTTYGRKR
jgi:hypothetical protein